MSPVLGLPLFLALAIGWLGPGLLALLLFRPPERASTWLALSAPVAAGIQIALECALKLVVTPPTGEMRVLANAAVTVALFVAVLVLRRVPPLVAAGDWRAVACVLGVPAVLALAFPDAIFRRELTSDGVETLAMARALGTHFLPRWPTESGLKGFGQGLIALAFPNAWFSSAGAGETGPRLTFLLFLGVIAAQIIALVEARRERQPGWIAVLAIAVSVLAMGVTLGLNVSFDPYFADPANPAGAETMAVAMMLAAFLALLKRRTIVFLLGAVLAYATLPSGLLFVAILGAATFVVARDRGWALRVGAAILLCVAAAFLYEKVYVPNALPAGVTMDAGSESLASRARLLIFTDVARLAFVVLPCGIVPFFFLFLWKKQDALSRMVTLTAAAMFLFFYVLATYSPHYFAPVMALAPVPYWRFARTRAAEWLGLGGAVAGLLLSLPWTSNVPQPFRTIGKTIRIAGPVEPAAADLLQSLAYLPWDEVDPARHLVASGLQLAENRPPSAEDEPEPDPDWVVQPESFPPEPGYEPMKSKAGWTLFARPGVKIEAVRDRGFPTDFQPPWYRVPREALFRGLTEKSRRYDLDLRSIFRR